MIATLATTLLGPLAGIECRRALGRGRSIWMRTAVGGLILLIALVMIWYWWLSQRIDDNFSGFGLARNGLAIIETALIATALLIPPSLLAGEFTGSRGRESLSLLLATDLRPGEIVVGRIAGKQAQVAMMLAAALPALVYYAVLCGFGIEQTATLVALPVCIALGSGGVAAAASVVSSRGRDALLAVFLLEFAACLGDWFGADAVVPFQQPDLFFGAAIGRAWLTALCWASLGVLGAGLAAWRLRPSILGERNNAQRKRSRRGWVVPPVDENRPMLWKELYIERVATLGRLGRWAGVLLVLGFGGGSLTLGLITFYSVWIAPNRTLYDSMHALLSEYVGGSGWFLGWLIQAAIGLRAAASIAAERERGSWDSILTSPLEPAEILIAKFWGNLRALTPLIASALLAWTIAAGCGAESWLNVFKWTLGLCAVGSFTAALGMRASLGSTTATRASGVVIAGWVGAMFAVPIVAAVVMAITAAVVMTVAFVSEWVAQGLGVTGTPSGMTVVRVVIFWGWPTLTNGIFILLALAILADTRLRFDALAGRVAGEGAGGLISRYMNAPKRLAKRKKHGPTPPTTPPTTLGPADAASRPAQPDAPPPEPAFESTSSAG